MTKKDYIIIATVFRKIGVADSHEYNFKREFLTQLAFELRKDNARFNQTKFMEACGLPI